MLCQIIIKLFLDDAGKVFGTTDLYINAYQSVVVLKTRWVIKQYHCTVYEKDSTGLNQGYG